MKAILKAEPGPGAELRNIEIPRIAKDELLIKVYRASICGSDMPIYQWNSWGPHRIKTPMVFGHEFCGTVVEAGSSTHGFVKGDFVSVESHIFCGACHQCLSGQRHVCRNFKIIGVDGPGGFAEYARIPARCGWKHSDRSLMDVGSIMEPLGNAVYATLVEEIVGRSILILGAGPQGLFAIQVARASGAGPLIVVEAAPYRQKLAKKMGADVVLDPRDPEILAHIRRAAKTPDGVDVVLELSGNPNAIHLGLQAIRNGGRYTAFGLPSGPVQVDWAEQIIFKGIRIHGIVGREIYRTWETMDHLLRAGAIDVRPAITHVFPLKDFKKAFDTMASKDKKCGKVVIQIS